MPHFWVPGSNKKCTKLHFWVIKLPLRRATRTGKGTSLRMRLRSSCPIRSPWGIRKMRKILAGIEFRTLESIVNHARIIKEKYKDGEKITGPDDTFLREFIALHPKSSEKIGCGIESFEVQTENHFHTRHFCLTRTDGKKDSFSHNRITLKPQNEKRKKALEALRHAISSQIIEFRNQNFFPGKTVCPFTNEVISTQNIHIDHAAPQTFAALVDDWMELEKISFEEIEVKTCSVGTDWHPPEIAKPEQRLSWQRYHSIHAHLRILSKTANLSHARRVR